MCMSFSIIKKKPLVYFRQVILTLKIKNQSGDNYLHHYSIRIDNYNLYKSLPTETTEFHGLWLCEEKWQQVKTFQSCSSAMLFYSQCLSALSQPNPRNRWALLQTMKVKGSLTLKAFVLIFYMCEVIAILAAGIGLFIWKMLKIVFMVEIT